MILIWLKQIQIKKKKNLYLNQRFYKHIRFQNEICWYMLQDFFL